MLFALSLEPVGAACCCSLKYVSTLIIIWLIMTGYWKTQSSTHLSGKGAGMPGKE